MTKSRVQLYLEYKKGTVLGRSAIGLINTQPDATSTNTTFEHETLPELTAVQSAVIAAIRQLTDEQLTGIDSIKVLAVN